MPVDIEIITSRLRNVKRIGPDRYKACCPAHNDRTPSMIVSRGTINPDTILVKCFAGCSPDDILHAIGLTFSDLYGEDYDYRKVQNTGPQVKDLDPLDLDAAIVAMAKQDLESGVNMSLEDRARVELALERLEMAG